MNPMDNSVTKTPRKKVTLAQDERFEVEKGNTLKK